MDNVVIRHCKKEDYNCIIQLLKQLWPDKIFDNNSRSIYEKALSSNSQKLIVCIADDVICGFCSLTVKNSLWQSGNIGHIDELVVDSCFRNKGIGKMLMNKMELIAMEDACKRIELDSAFHRKDAHEFYLKNAFENRAYLFSKKLFP